MINIAFFMHLQRLFRILLNICILGSLIIPTSAFAIEYGGLGGRPAHPDPTDPRTNNWFVYTLNPGTIKNDEIMIVNNTGETKNVELYSADNTPSSEGGFALKQKVETMTEVGSWIHINEPGPFTIQHNETKIIPFTITVPSNPEPGEHTGGIIVQEVKPATAENGGIALSLRMGVRVYVTIPGDIIKKLSILPLRTTITSEDTIIHVPVRNEGNVSRDGKLNINVYSVLTGKKVASFVDINIQVLRESTLFWNAKWARNWHGGLYRIEANVVYEGQSGAQTIFSNPMTIWLWPIWQFIAIIAGTLLLILIGIFLTRRRQKGKNSEKKVITTKKSKKGTKKKPMARTKKKKQNTH